MVSILDLELLNPLSRLVKDENETLEQAVEKVRQELKKEGDKVKVPLKKNVSKFKPTFELVMTNAQTVQLEESSKVVIEVITATGE